MATASSQKRVFQMPDVTEMALAIVIGYHVAAAVVAMFVLPGLPKLRDSALVWPIEAVLLAVLAGIGFFVWSVMHRARWTLTLGRFLILGLAVLRTIAAVAMVVMASTGGASGIEMLPRGVIGDMLVQASGGQVLPVVAVGSCVVDLAVTIAAYVAFFTMNNRGTAAYYDAEAV